MRLSKIVTRTGDSGSTGLADGTRVAKDHARIAALGSVDELNSQIGLLLTETLAPDVRAVLMKIQNDLFDLGGALALPTNDTIAESKIAWLEEQITFYNSRLPPLREFILPGGSRAGALCHVARTVARRVERDLVALAHFDDLNNAKPESPQKTLPQHALPFLNRLSDLLFVLSRIINKEEKAAEVFWEH